MFFEPRDDNKAIELQAAVQAGCDVLGKGEDGDGAGSLAVCHSVPSGVELAFPLGRDANEHTATLRPTRQQAAAINSSEFQEALRLTDRVDAATRRESTPGVGSLAERFRQEGRRQSGVEKSLQQVLRRRGAHLEPEAIAAVIG